jgi:hypothetical protein
MNLLNYFYQQIEGTVAEKQFIFRPSLEEALTYAIQDIRLNWQKYKLAYMEKENGQEKN